MVGDRNNQLTLVDRVRREGDRLVLPAGFRSAVTDYLLIETPVALVLVPESGDKVPPRGGVDEEGERTDISPPDRDELLRNAFARLRSRIGASAWALSETPYRDLLAGFRDLASQPAVAEDVAVALRSLPAVRSSVEMLFTTVAMSARAQWRDAPPEIRTILARGWFLGRWLPTFLVVDGPIRRFLNSQAFGRQAPPVPMLKHVRRFLAEPIFMALRHAFVHWSFAWATSGDDSEIIAYDGDAQEAEHRLTREEADAFHVITFAAVCSGSA